ncbi:MAG: hypothetical protein U5O39_03670 [Gammaproteobacteria bacterium]|nr:hypothetical protein [Gammaproteobacteria bacterium]
MPCSDFSQRASGDGDVSAGPHRSPLGLSADPGGLPLYIDGQPVGGIGVISDGIYGLDKITTDFDDDLDESIALAGTSGFAAPIEIRANRVTVLGKTLRFSDAVATDLLTDPAGAPATPGSNAGDFLAVPGYIASAGVRAGTAFGEPESGIRPADPAVFADGNGEPLDAFVLVDGNNDNRYPARAGTDAPGGDVANRMAADEVQVLLNEALAVANRSRAQIRVPPGVQARVTISVVDTNGGCWASLARATDRCSVPTYRCKRHERRHSFPERGRPSRRRPTCCANCRHPCI